MIWDQKYSLRSPSCLGASMASAKELPSASWTKICSTTSWQANSKHLSKSRRSGKPKNPDNLLQTMLAPSVNLISIFQKRKKPLTRSLLLKKRPSPPKIMNRMRLLWKPRKLLNIRKYQPPRLCRSQSAHTPTGSTMPKTCARPATESMEETSTLGSVVTLTDCSTLLACVKPATWPTTTRREPRSRESRRPRPKSKQLRRTFSASR